MIYTMPKSEAEKWEPLIIECKRALVLSDIHVPYHDSKALGAAVRYGKRFNPDLVLLNGDLADFFAISRFQKDMLGRSFKKEIKALKQFQAWLRQEFPKSRIVWKKGNHEERYEHFLINKAPELLDIECLTMESILECEKHGVETAGDQRIIMLGKLPVLHGHEFPKGMTSPVNPARGFFMRGNERCLAGHLHKKSEHAETSMMGRLVSCWSTGCLCGLHPEYARINKWGHGFATVEVKSDGDFQVKNLGVYEGKVF